MVPGTGVTNASSSNRADHRKPCLLIMAARHPSADLRILTHDRTDRAPQSFQAAIDFGLVAISVLVTWTAKRIA